MHREIGLLLCKTGVPILWASAPVETLPLGMLETEISDLF